VRGPPLEGGTLDEGSSPSREGGARLPSLRKPSAKIENDLFYSNQNFGFLNKNNL
jgi:hypothetical protein